MRRFKVALAGLDGQAVPDWVPQALAAKKALDEGRVLPGKR